jgi:hypothetical protein
MAKNDIGQEVPGEGFEDLIDPFENEPISTESVDRRRCLLEWKNFKSILQQLRS